MRLRHTLITLPAFAFMTGVGAAHRADAQPPLVEIPHRVSCSQCQLHSTKIFELGDSGDNLVAPQSPLRRDSRGRFYALGFNARNIIVWDSAGRRIATIGSAGDGPGEFSGSIRNLLIAPGDSIVAIDVTLRVTVFSPSYQLVRTTKAPARGTSALLPGGRILFGGLVRTPQQAGLRYHVVGPDGTIERSFGGEDHIIKPGEFADRTIGLFELTSDGRTLWHWNPFEYRLEEWTVEGTRGMTFDVKAPWYETPRAPEITPLPPSQMKAQVQGLIGTLKSNVPDTTSGRATLGSRLALAGIDVNGRPWVLGHNPGDPPRSHILEIIDPSRREKVMSVRVEHDFRLLNASGLAYSKEWDSLGVVKISVWRVRIGSE
jgi:hypothetical protein